MDDVSDSKESGRAAIARNPLAPQPEIDLTGRTLGDFHVQRHLGQGGMGQVYLAEQISLKRKVALKLLRPDLAANAVSLQRFQVEAEAAARASHANIVQVYAIGEYDGMHFMALEYVEGRNLREFLEKKGPPELLLGLSIMRQVAAALERANELGIIHRDIKPENILLTRKGEVKVADFGLSRIFGEGAQPLNLTQTGMAMGTPLYMSPEQVEGKPVDPRTDIYSFGVTCYHMFAGEPPFRGTLPFEVALQHVQKEPAPIQEIRPDLPLALCAVIHKMMAKAPENRFQTGREIVRAIARLRDAIVGATLNAAPALGASSTGFSSSAAVSVSPLPAGGSGWRRGLVAATIVLALLAGLALGWWRNRTGAAPTPETEQARQPAQGNKDREQQLLKQVEEHAGSGKLRELKEGFQSATELAAIYLKSRRLKEADALFKDLDRPDRLPPYQQFGKLGTAIVLAFQDQPEESNKLFVRVLDRDHSEKVLAPLSQWLKNSATLRELVSMALHFNLANNRAGFPKSLERYLTPPAPTLKSGE